MMRRDSCGIWAYMMKISDYDQDLQERCEEVKGRLNVNGLREKQIDAEAIRVTLSYKRDIIYKKL